MIRWRIAILVAVAIAINYLDRLTLPSLIDDIRKQMDFSGQAFALLNTAFLGAYGAMYLVGGKLMDWLGTRRGFALIIVFWSLACASHGFATGLISLVICRLLLGIGEGGGFPAATRAVTEWFPVKERSTAMGIINGATGVGGMVALPLVSLLLYHTGWFGIDGWRWTFFITGSLGFFWLIWWLADYHLPEKHRGVRAEELAHIQSGTPAAKANEPKIPLAVLFQHKETWGIVIAKFLSDAAWYFILFWLPTYLNNLHKTLHPQDTTYSFAKTASVAWIPHAAAFAGCLIGGSLSSWLIARKTSVDFSRKLALFLSAIIMPLLVLVPYFNNTAIVIALLSAGYFGQQSWSTLVMVLPTDLFPKRAVGTVAGLVGLGGALGGAVLGQFASYLLDHGYTYRPVMLVAGLLHVTAFVVILITVPKIRPLVFNAQLKRGAAAAWETLQLALKVQIPALLMMLLGLTVVERVINQIHSGPINASMTYVVHLEHYHLMMVVGIISLLVFLVLAILAVKRHPTAGIALCTCIMTLAGISPKLWFIADATRWHKDQAFAACCVVASLLADVILFIASLTFLVKRSQRVVPVPNEEAVA